MQTSMNATSSKAVEMADRASTLSAVSSVAASPASQETTVKLVRRAVKLVRRAVKLVCALSNGYVALSNMYVALYIQQYDMQNQAQNIMTHFAVLLQTSTNARRRAMARPAVSAELASTASIRTRVCAPRSTRAMNAASVREIRRSFQRI